MPRKSKSKAQPESPAGEPSPASLKEQYGLKTGAELAKEQLTAYEAQTLMKAEWTQPGEVPLQEPDYKLAKYEAPERQAAQIKTARPFIGSAGSGRGRQIVSEDDSWVARAGKKPLVAGEVTLCQKNGFDVTSPEGEPVTEMVGSKAEIRRVGGDVNHVIYALTGSGAGRER